MKGYPVLNMKKNARIKSCNKKGCLHYTNRVKSKCDVYIDRRLCVKRFKIESKILGKE